MNLKSLIFLIILSIGCKPKMQKSSLPVYEKGGNVDIRLNKYTCFQTKNKLKIDGRLNESAWKNAKWTATFGHTTATANTPKTYETKAKMLWDEQYFYVAAELKDEHLYASIHQKDGKLYLDDVFEVFIDPDGDAQNYYELEINGFSTIWDLKMNKPYRDGGKADSQWDIKGLEKGIDLNGTMNEPADKDKAWKVELAIPWTAFAENQPTGQKGEMWRINLTRVDWDKLENGIYTKSEKLENMWTWSPVGERVDFHQPEKWGYIQFVRE